MKPILTIEDGEVVPLTRVRGRQKALDEFRRRFEEATNDGPGLRVGIAHAEAEETVEQLRTLVLETRPQAEIELVTTLGAVVGTHAGPGTVGFFLLQSRLVVRLAVVVVERLDAPDHAEPAPRGSCSSAETTRCRWAAGFRR